MLQDDAPRTEEEMRARVRDLRRRTFPERRPWAARVIELRRLASEAAAPRLALPLPVASAPPRLPALTGEIDDEADLSALCGPRPSLKAILFAVSAAFHAPVVDIVSHRRSRPICEARHAAYRIARDLTLLTLPQIGQRIGGRDHTTVLHGIKKTQSLFPDLVLDPEASAESCARILAKRYGALT
jgi:chromosomal replication initiator protein